MVNYKDLRQWMDEADRIGELKSIEGADPRYDIGAISELNSKNLGPAIIFDKIKGYAPGFRILTNSASNIRTFNLTFGLPVENTIRDTIKTLMEKTSQWAADSDKFPPKVVESAPILENVKEGKDIDLDIFPVPLWHELDGGPYIGTGVGVITRDPDTGEINMGTYRSQLHDRNTVGFYISPGKHGRLHRDKYFARGEPCPVVMVYGFDPLLFLISSSSVPVDEFKYAGACRQRPIPIIKGKTTGLPIPANAEIAIEGFSNPDETMKEGPFGEWTGTYASSAREEPFIKPTTLYYRNNPVLLGSAPGKGSNADHQFFNCVWRSALLWDEINQAGVPNVMGVWRPLAGGSRLLVVVSVKQAYAGHAAQAGHVACQVRSGAYAGRYVIVVDDDIDPFDMDDVLWALCTRSEAVEMDIIKKAWSTPLDPRIRKPTDDFSNSRGIIYAVKPYEWYNEFPPTVGISEQLRKQTLDKWANIFGGRWKV